MATTERGVYYLTEADDSSVADLTVITKAMADSTEAALDTVANSALPKAGGTMSGPIAMGSNKVTGLGSGTASTDAVNKSQLDAVKATADAALPKAGGTMSGAITLSGDPTSNLHATTKQYADTMLPKAGGTMTGNLIIHKSNGYSQAIFRNAAAAYWVGTDPGAGDALTVAVLNKDTLAYVSTALSISKSGHVASGSHVAGILIETTNAQGTVTVPLPTAPSGTTWHLVGTPVQNSSPAQPFIVMVQSGQPSFQCFNMDGSARANTLVAIRWHAIATVGA